VAAAAVVDGEVAVEAVVVEHVQEVDSRLRRLRLLVRPLLARQLPAQRLGLQVVLQPVLGLQVVLQPLPGPQAALPARKLRRVAHAPAALRQGKVPPLASVQPDRVRTSPAAVHRPAR
jgi:hypothetical protein